MEQEIFTNEVILSWLQYYAKNTTVDLEHVKMIDITKKNKNVIPTVESHRTTMVFSNAGIEDIFYRLWNAGLGECEVWYNEGSEPEGHKGKNAAAWRAGGIYEGQIFTGKSIPRMGNTHFCAEWEKSD